MRKLSFFLILFVLYTSRILAYDPVIIDTAIPGSPVDPGKDQDYYTNDPSDGLKCTVPLTVSQTFDPIPTGTDSNGNPVYQEQVITQIQGSADFNVQDPKYSNLELDQTEDHLNSHYNNFTPGSQAAAFTSYDLNNKDGASGMDRSLTYKVGQCLRSQRLIHALLSLDPSSKEVYHNEQIAWNCPAEGPYPIYTVDQKPDGVACTPVRLSDIAAALASKEMFYPTSADCYKEATTSSPQTLAAVITLPAGFHPNPLTSTQALTLFPGVSTADNGSLASTVEYTGGLTASTKTTRLLPKGSMPATDLISQQFVPYSQDVKNRDICQKVAGTNKSLDQPNPFSLAVIIKGLHEIVDNVSRTITGQTTQIVSFEPKMQAGINVEQTMVNNLLPRKQQQEKNTNNPEGSSTNESGVVTDPGSSVARAVFAKDLLPLHF